MGGIAVCAAIFLMLLLMVCCIPISYEAYVQLHEPCHLRGRLQWFGHALYYEWDYQPGERVHKTCYIGWQKYPSQTAISTEPAEVASQPTAQAAWEKIEKESQTVTYQALQYAQPETADNAKKERPWWWPYVWQQDFAEALLTFGIQILYHSRIRKFYLEGSLGLPEAYETGMLAGALYAVMPASISRLRFNFVEEEYDCRGCALGRMYPASLFRYVITFTLTQPVRELISTWLKKERDKRHG